MMDGNLITSNDIINKTGISETTLDNFIILGILPKPVVKYFGSEEKEVRQISYFPAEVLERILQVKFVKKQEKSMKGFTQMFEDIIGAILNRYKKEDSRNLEIIHHV